MYVYVYVYVYIYGIYIYNFERPKDHDVFVTSLIHFGVIHTPTSEARLRPYMYCSIFYC